MPAVVEFLAIPHHPGSGHKEQPIDGLKEFCHVLILSIAIFIPTSHLPSPPSLVLPVLLNRTERHIKPREKDLVQGCLGNHPWVPIRTPWRWYRPNQLGSWSSPACCSLRVGSCSPWSLRGPAASRCGCMGWCSRHSDSSIAV